MGITQKYDKLFEKYGEKIPVSFLRSLGYWESSMNPKLADPGSGWGLLQVVESVRGDFNIAHPRSRYNRQDMLLPEPNIRVACWLLNLIINQWTRNHDNRWPGLAMDWKSDAWVELFIAGWNSGWSQHGIGKVIRYMIKSGAIESGDTPSLQLVSKYARGSGSVFAKYSGWNRTYAWAPKVRASFRKEEAMVEVPLVPEDKQNLLRGLQLVQHDLRNLEVSIAAIIKQVEDDEQ